MPAPEFLPLSLPDNAGPPRGLPLQGLTMLAVDDSRFASEALRLLCQRSGARLRRADSLATARRHLLVYRPDVVIVDLGLPDGCGTELIRDLARHGPAQMVVLGTSGDPAGARAARAAGAQGFLDKPPESLAAFQAAILHHLPGPASPTATDAQIRPDRAALRDDLALAAGLLARGPDAGDARYLTRFLASLACSAHDTALAQAASEAGSPLGMPRLAALVSARLAETPAFARPDG